MKKEGIQTRNRKLSSKSKKKKGMAGGCLPIGSHLGMSDLMKPLDPSKAFSGGFPGSMGKHSICNLQLVQDLLHFLSSEHFNSIAIFCNHFKTRLKKCNVITIPNGRRNKKLILICCLFLSVIEIGQHSHLSGSLHPAHAHMHGGWYASGMGALGASSGLQSGFSSGGLAGGVVPHSQSYHLMVSKQPDFQLLLIAFPKKLTRHSWNTFSVPILV